MKKKARGARQGTGAKRARTATVETDPRMIVAEVAGSGGHVKIVATAALLEK